jgi:hypothetical protein
MEYVNPTERNGVLNQMVGEHLWDVAMAMRSSLVCVVDPSDKMARTAKNWKLRQRMKEDMLAKGTRATIGPLTYSGIARLRSIERDFKSFFSNGGSWEIHQTKVFDMFCNANIKKILGNDIDSCLDYVMWYKGWSDIQSHVFVQSYRGLGKSAMSSAAMAAFFTNIPNYTLTMYGGPEQKAVELFETFDTYVRGILDRNPERKAQLVYAKSKMRMKLSNGHGDIRWVALQLSRGSVRLNTTTLISI